MGDGYTEEDVNRDMIPNRQIPIRKAHLSLIGSYQY